MYIGLEPIPGSHLQSYLLLCKVPSTTWTLAYELDPLDSATMGHSSLSKRQIPRLTP